MRRVLIAAALALGCSGCADVYGPAQYAGVYPDYGYTCPGYTEAYPYYPYYAPYYAAPFVGLGAGAVIFSDHDRFRDRDFDRFHRFPQNNFANSGSFQHAAPPPPAGPMGLGTAMRLAAPNAQHAAPPPAPAPAPRPSSLGAAMRQGVLGHP